MQQGGGGGLPPAGTLAPPSNPMTRPMDAPPLTSPQFLLQPQQTPLHMAPQPPQHHNLMPQHHPHPQHQQQPQQHPQHQQQHLIQQQQQQQQQQPQHPQVSYGIRVSAAPPFHPSQAAGPPPASFHPNSAVPMGAFHRPPMMPYIQNAPPQPAPQPPPPKKKKKKPPPKMGPDGLPIKPPSHKKKKAAPGPPGPFPAQMPTIRPPLPPQLQPPFAAQRPKAVVRKLSPALLRQRQENEAYARKHYLFKRSIKALVFKNGALCDEVARLKQRIATVAEERKILLRRLFHHKRLEQRRRQMAEKRLLLHTQAQASRAAAAPTSFEEAGVEDKTLAAIAREAQAGLKETP